MKSVVLDEEWPEDLSSVTELASIHNLSEIVEGRLKNNSSSNALSKGTVLIRWFILSQCLYDPFQSCEVRHPFYIFRNLWFTWHRTIRPDSSMHWPSY